MQADMMTKIMPRPSFDALRSEIGLLYAHAPQLTPRMKDSLSLSLALDRGREYCGAEYLIYFYI